MRLQLLLALVVATVTAFTTSRSHLTLARRPMKMTLPRRPKAAVARCQVQMGLFGLGESTDVASDTAVMADAQASPKSPSSSASPVSSSGPSPFSLTGLRRRARRPEKLSSMAKDFGKIAGELKEVPKEFAEGMKESEDVKMTKAVESAKEEDTVKT